ncbi:MAG: hypothetical protein LBI17_03990 [Rickettsiales bacterium]|jgi:hypothetical protein|nr:hypothetical protein [Rickettsiales bacterium]
MFKQTISSTQFSRGEISPNLFGRGDVGASKNGAMAICNMGVIGTGGIERRSGLRYADTLPDEGKLVAFEYSASRLFLLYFGDNLIRVYDKSGGRLCEFVSPYPLDSLSRMRWCQKGSELYIAHPDIPPKVISYDEVGDEWSLSNWKFSRNGEYGYSCQPFNRFPDAEGVSIAPSGTAGSITLSSDRPFFKSGHVGVLLGINGGEVEIAGVESPTSAAAVVKVDLDGVDPGDSWEEQAFSHLRGYPTSIAFHQNRLVIGGSRSLPNRMWFSKVGEYMNFDLGEGLDDEAIEFDIMSDKLSEIVCVFSGRHLQVFTSDAEWMVSGSPLTPASLSVRQQTKIGSPSDRFVQPKLIEGSTIFVARNNKEIREFFYGDVNESYESEDLMLLSSHMMDMPREQDYDQKRRTLYVVQGDGSLSVLMVNKSVDLNAWVRYVTQGEFVSLAIVVDEVYAIVRRGGNCFLERFEEGVFTDCTKTFEFESGRDEVDGLECLEGRAVYACADGYVFELCVKNGGIRLPLPFRRVCVGLAYTHTLCPLPLLLGGVRPPRAVRLLELVLRVVDTPLVQIDTGRGLRNITSLSLDSSGVLDSGVPALSGDVRVKSSGFIRNFEAPLWKIQGSKPYNVKILNVSATVESVR